MKYEELLPLQKAAIALVAFGTEVAALVLKGLSQAEVEKITVEIANLGDVPSEIEEQVMNECYQIFMARQYISQGGVDFAKEILEKAVGAKKAQEILARLESSFRTSGFNLLKNIDSRQLVSFLQNEHPQTIALILSQLTPQQAAGVLSDLPSELQAEVALRIATMEKISPEILKDIESTLEGHFDTSTRGDLSASGGAKTMAEILNLIESSAEKNILHDRS